MSMPEIYTNNDSFRHSNEVNEIITRVPSWILRWGLTLFFCVLIGVIGFSAIINYPDIIKTTLKIKTNHSNTAILCDCQGDVGKILISPEDRVKSGQVLAYVKCEDSTIHALTSRTHGKVFYNGIVRRGESISKNSEIFYVEPDCQDFYGEMTLPQNIKEVHKGQTVLIKLKNYPFEKYGIVKGTVKYVSYLDGTGVFIAEVEIRKIVTDKNYPVQLTTGMNADAEVIIKSSSALQRLWDGLRRF